MSGDRDALKRRLAELNEAKVDAETRKAALVARLERDRRSSHQIRRATANLRNECREIGAEIRRVHSQLGVLRKGKPRLPEMFMTVAGELLDPAVFEAIKDEALDRMNVVVRDEEKCA